jgi:hypothetical protein
MASRFLTIIRDAMSKLNPAEIRASAHRPVKVMLLAGDGAVYALMEDFLAPATLSRGKRLEAMAALMRAGDAPDGRPLDLLFYEDGAPPPAGWRDGHDAFRFNLRAPERLPAVIVETRDEFGLPLARLFPPFRAAAARRIIHTISKENALFSLMTALPNVLPSGLGLPWAVGEFASDTAVLTANQIRMAFFLAAASDRDVGFREQRNQIGSIVAGAWGWRSLARELTGKIPFGGGLIPKAAIAYAGTFVVGQSLERYFRLGYGLTRAERVQAYEGALDRGKRVAGALLGKLKRERGEKP